MQRWEKEMDLRNMKQVNDTGGEGGWEREQAKQDSPGLGWRILPGGKTKVSRV